MAGVRRRFSKEFKIGAVKLVTEQGYCLHHLTQPRAAEPQATDLRAHIHKRTSKAARKSEKNFLPAEPVLGPTRNG